jgi:hypothetical protein
MNLPDRLLDATGEDGRIARKLLDDDFAEPPSGAKERVWSQVSSSVGAPATSSAGTSTLGGKIIAGVIGIGAVGLGLWTLSDTKPARIAPPPPAITAPAVVQSTPVTTSTPTDPPVVTNDPKPTPKAPAPVKATAETPSVNEPETETDTVSEKQSALLAESRLVAEARDALRAGNVGETQKLLTQLGKEFPRGALMQEREAIAIELLWKSGQKQLASERAQAFIRAYPSSVHTARLKAFVTPE